MFLAGFADVQQPGRFEEQAADGDQRGLRGIRVRLIKLSLICAGIRTIKPKIA